LKKYNIIKAIRDLSLLGLVFFTILAFVDINLSTIIPPTQEELLMNFVIYLIISLVLSTVLIVFTILLLRNKENIQINKELEIEEL